MPSSSPASSRLRALMLPMLFGVAFVSYFDRVNLSIAAEGLMPELGLSKGDLAWIFNLFLIGYAICQVPAGWLGDRFGARSILGWSTLAVGVCTVATAFVPGAAARGKSGSLVLLCGMRFVLGCAEAAAFPVATQAASQWFAQRRRGLANAAVLLGSTVGSALTGPVISWLMIRTAWRSSLMLSALPAFVVGGTWLVVRSPPSRKEANGAKESAQEAGSLMRVLTSADVLLLSISYFSEGYLLFTFVSWLYIYLVEVRHFSLLAGGLASSLPWMTAMAATPVGGLVADLLARRAGRVRASQTLITTGYLLSGTLLFVAALAQSRPLAVLALCLSLGALYMAEPSFWAVANGLDPRHGAAISGLMNTVGIVGGIVSNALVPWLVSHSGWLAAFGSSAIMGVFTALVWVVLAARAKRSAGEVPLIPATPPPSCC